MPKISQYSDGGSPTDQDYVVIVRGGANYKIKDFVHNQVLNGLSTATNAVITTIDTVLTALGKLQAQITGLASVYAPIAKGVTNGDSHDHNGGDGAQINHTTLSNIGTNTHAQIDTHISTYAITGEIKLVAGSLPSGFLECNGADVSRTTYGGLFAAIGTTYGVGDGSTTFNVPDLRGRAPIGTGTGAGLTARAMGATGGAETHQLTTAEMPSHTHNVAIKKSAPALGSVTSAAAPAAGGTDADHTTSSAGSDAAHNNMQPFNTVRFAIKY